jgi:hypothetical protein
MEGVVVRLQGGSGGGGAAQQKCKLADWLLSRYVP